MGFRRILPLPSDRVPFILDNVVDTGTTAKAAVKALGGGNVVSYAMSDVLLTEEREMRHCILR
jgi:predicted amidophosphoribosyltransferase